MLVIFHIWESKQSIQISMVETEGRLLGSEEGDQLGCSLQHKLSGSSHALLDSPQPH